jgi:hypothetical protein
MQISTFGDLLDAAGSQASPQRMLFVFVKTSIQKDASSDERARFEAGGGGALLPQFCVDLSPRDIPSFGALVAEADQQSPDWDKVLVACMDAPSSGSAKTIVDQALRAMIARVQTGQTLSGYLCFERDGTPLLFE